VPAKIEEKHIEAGLSQDNGAIENFAARAEQSVGTGNGNIPIRPAQVPPFEWHSILRIERHFLETEIEVGRRARQPLIHRPRPSASDQVSQKIGRYEKNED
jgi:hypothetical protein